MNAGSSIIDHYGFIFLHDWPTKQNEEFDVLHSDGGVNQGNLVSNWNDYTPLVREKYARRIERFKEACSGSQKVFFIRYRNIIKHQAIMLRDLIEKKYKKLEFELIIVSDVDKTAWNINKIKKFYMTEDVQGQIDLWMNIFGQVGIEYNQKNLNGLFENLVTL